MNVNDTERMATLLEMSGYACMPSPDQADLIIINSCSIREKPVHKVHSEVGRYKKLKARNPDLKIGVAGCVAQQERHRLLKDIPLLDFVFGTDAIDELPFLLKELQTKKTVMKTKLKPKEPYHIETLIRNPGVSAFVNISKGCDNFCTFCVVPFTRGREISRPIEHLVSDVKKLCDRGVKEVTLLGQNVNSYRSENKKGFGDLLQALVLQTPITRIRFSTPHPKDFDEELIDIMQSHREKIMDCIHLPVQSGNTEVLHRMNRGYSREEYIKKAHMILNRMPESVLSTDIIVGFPGESKKQFEDTMSLLDEVPYETIFSFKYSPRPFTKAAKYSDQIPEEEKSERLSALQQKHTQLAFDLARKYKGQVLPVLVEKQDVNTGLFMGRSTQNKLVYFEGSLQDIGEVIPIKIKKVQALTFYGDKANEAN